VLLGTGIDILAAMLATHALPEAAAGIALLLLFNVGSAALLVPLRFGLGGALLAGSALMVEYVWNALGNDLAQRPFAEVLSATPAGAAWTCSRQRSRNGCGAGAARARFPTSRCGSAPTRPRCCRASPACSATATSPWCSSTTPRRSRAAPNR
jgi:hypothetical protein